MTEKGELLTKYASNILDGKTLKDAVERYRKKFDITGEM